MRKRLFVLAAFVAAVAAAGALPAGADNDSGFHTSVPAMLTPLAPGGDVKPIISVGDSVRGYRFEAIPDGISFTLNGRGRWTSMSTTRPRSFHPATRSDLTNSLVSKLRLNQHSAGVLRGDYAIRNVPNSSGSARIFSSEGLGVRAHASSRTRKLATSSCGRVTHGIRRAFPSTSHLPSRRASWLRST